MEKEDILKNVSNLTADQLFKFISEGSVTLQDLQSTGCLDAVKRKKINDLVTNFQKEDNAAWAKASYGNESSLRDYISNYPTGIHVQEAKDKIDSLVQERKNAQSAKHGILNDIRENSNRFSPRDIRHFLSNVTITKNDLIDNNIPNNIIDYLENMIPPRLQLGETPSSIPEGYTEVYFWGIPGSGKTCALAAILSTAEKEGYLNIATGPGYDYTTKLKNIFINGTSTLPPPSPVESTQYLPFTLKKRDEKHHRSVSLIELSGEIFQCFYYKNANVPFPTQDHQVTFNNLMNFLNGKNRKTHFFFIDYDMKNKQDNFGYTQADYLAAASTFFKNNEIFGKTADAIYVVLTKSDLMPVAKDERIKHSKEHLNNHNFSAFINTLRDNCKKYSINGGKLIFEPFTLGEVYFQEICEFDNESANKIIDLLFERIKPSKNSILEKLNVLNQ